MSGSGWSVAARNMKGIEMSKVTTTNSEPTAEQRRLHGNKGTWIYVGPEGGHWCAVFNCGYDEDPRDTETYRRHASDLYGNKGTWTYTGPAGAVCAVVKDCRYEDDPREDVRPF